MRVASWNADQSDPQCAHSHTEDDGSEVGAPDHEVRLGCSGVEDREEEAERHEDRGEWRTVAGNLSPRLGEGRFVDVSQGDQREEQQDTGVTVAGGPQSLA